MQQDETFNDWLFRYQYVYRLRRTEKNKNRFLSALVKDITSVRTDIKVMEYGHKKKSAFRNVYVGDVKKADRIICTYYDTPPRFFGSYIFFDRSEQGKRTLRFIAVSGILMILAGFIGTFLYMKMISTDFILLSMQSLPIIFSFGIYFYCLGKVTQGLSERKTVVRNTSSLLTMLELIRKSHDSKTAFAFLDDGSYGETGLELLKSSSKKNAEIICLDSVGATAPLHVINEGITKAETASDTGTGKLTFIISARTSDDKVGSYYLDKSDLKQKKVNIENMTKVVELLK